MDKSKDKLETTRRKWDLHLSLTASNLDALDDLQEISACFTTKLHTHLAKDLRKQQTWWEQPQPDSKLVINMSERPR